LGISYESQFVQNGTSSWQYFASPPYSAEYSGYPFSNAQPTAFFLDTTFTSSWTITLQYSN
jgi:hypothetical protein